MPTEASGPGHGRLPRRCSGRVPHRRLLSRAVSGETAAAPQSSVMNSRRLMGFLSPRVHPPHRCRQCRFVHHSNGRRWQRWVTRCRADGVSGTDGLPSIAEGRALRYAIFSSTPTSGPTRAVASTDGVCHNVCLGRALQDGLSRATNVRAASMYQVSKWSICSGPLWVSARIRDLLPERPQGPKWHPVSWLRRADRSSISSFHLANLGGEVCRYLKSSVLCSRFDVGDQVRPSPRSHRRSLTQ